VVRTLDQLIDYYRRREPGSPVPVALVRAKKWVGMDFLAVLRDISPESLDEVRKILVSGSDTSEDDDDN
jgi:type VI secretion system protein ImpA